MPSSAQRSRPASVVQHHAPRQRRGDTAHGNDDVASPARSQKNARPRTGATRRVAAAMRSTAASVSPPSASATDDRHLAASTAYTPKSAGPSARAITSDATNPRPSRTDLGRR